MNKPKTEYSRNPFKCRISRVQSTVHRNKVMFYAPTANTINAAFMFLQKLINRTNTIHCLKPFVLSIESEKARTLIIIM